MGVIVATVGCGVGVVVMRLFGAGKSDIGVRFDVVARSVGRARVQTTNTAVPHGLYVGDLKSPDGRELGPVHLYVSRATEA